MRQNRPKNKNLEAVWAEISAKAWTDETFKKQLFANPEKILQEYGLDTRQMHYRVVENTEKTTNLILPEKPKGNLSQEELKQIAAAGSQAILWRC